MANIRVASTPFGSASYIGTNSATFANSDFVSLTGGFAVKSTAGKKVIGTANGAATFASNNQTVAKAKLSVLLAEPFESRYEIPTSASITDADVGKFYDLNASQVIDVATALVSENGLVVNTSDAGAATDPVIQRQFRLDKVLTSTLGVFTVV